LEEIGNVNRRFLGLGGGGGGGGFLIRRRNFEFENGKKQTLQLSKEVPLLITFSF
jgi:hypothetical protein